MKLKDLEKLMVAHGIVIRAIPVQHSFTVEIRHKDKYPGGIEYYDEKCQRNMLKVVEKNSQGGKFVITQERTQNGTVNYWGNPSEKFTGKPAVFYDSIEQAVSEFLRSLESMGEEKL